MILNETQKTIRRAIRRLKTHGWTKGKYIEENGRCCALGALRYAATGSVWQVMFFTGNGPSRSKYTAAVLAVRRALPNDSASIAQFNDKASKSRVIALLEKAVLETAAPVKK